MGIHLFKHNQRAYDAAVAMMDEKGKAAVIHPTGTGKSFVAFKLAEDNPDKKICWLSPSEYIFRTQLENLQGTLPQGEMACTDNICFLSYSRLMKNEEDMDKLEPDYIILDEFHRCGAAEWGRSVRKLLAMYPTAKVLGLSATNIRYLDNQRDMAQEIFEGHIASEMTLGEALVLGILATPRYVAAWYPGVGKAHIAGSLSAHDSIRKDSIPYKRELQKLEERVETFPDGELTVRNMELLEQLRRALEQADGLDKIFARHMKKGHGKYIVFCADKEHMDEMKEHVGEWFHLIDTTPHIYTAYYDSPETSRNFEAFKEDDSEHLKLLFCIDMLNEGVHMEDIDGVILLRPTVSPIIYLQQIGRALSAGGAAEPVIFDLVNNFEGLACIDCLEQEVKEAFALMPCTHGEGGAFQERFQIIDEMMDCRRLFGQLQANLASPWEVYYRSACEYFEKNGNLRISKKYVTSEGLTLGSWIQTQRKVYAGKTAGSLTEEKIQRLEDIGMVWNVRENGWEEGYRELEIYHRKFGNVDVKAAYISESGFPLGKWVSNLRVNVKKKGREKMLSGEQLEKLDALGMIWSKNAEKWERYLDAVREYRRIYGDLKIPLKYVTEDGLPLGKWIHAIRHGKSGNKTRMETLSAEQIAQLDALGMEWEKGNITLWNMKYELAKEYYEQHGNLNVPVSYSVEGVKLGRWISNIRVKRRNPESSGMVLDEERIRRLDSIGMDWK